VLSHGDQERIPCLANALPGACLATSLPRIRLKKRNLPPWEGIHPIKGTITKGEPVAGGSNRTLKAPFAGLAVAYLRKR